MAFESRPTLDRSAAVAGFDKSRRPARRRERSRVPIANSLRILAGLWVWRTVGDRFDARRRPINFFYEYSANLSIGFLSNGFLKLVSRSTFQLPRKNYAANVEDFATHNEGARHDARQYDRSPEWGF